MVLCKTKTDILTYIGSIGYDLPKIGFVPTMGALHEGHLTLVREAKRLSSFVICSIFVNPAQFNEEKDYKAYPITIENDIFLLEKERCDMLFLPSISEIYPTGFHNRQHYPIGNIENVLEGAYRPGHFQGVCLVIDRLLDILKPNILLLGQKDYQQCLVIQFLVNYKNMPVEIKVIPTVREASGLAMSSRNLRLSITGREKAAIIYRVLQDIKQNGFQLTEDWQQHIRKQLIEAGFESIDYVVSYPSGFLDNSEDRLGLGKKVALIAANIEGVRLIDNIIGY